MSEEKQKVLMTDLVRAAMDGRKGSISFRDLTFMINERNKQRGLSNINQVKAAVWELVDAGHLALTSTYQIVLAEVLASAPKKKDALEVPREYRHYQLDDLLSRGRYRLELEQHGDAKAPWIAQLYGPTPGRQMLSLETEGRGGTPTQAIAALIARVEQGQ